MAGLPEDVRGDDPCPDELPEYRRPPARISIGNFVVGRVCLPFPALAHLRLFIFLGAGMDFCACDTPAVMELFGDAPHYNSKDELLLLDSSHVPS